MIGSTTVQTKCGGSYHVTIRQTVASNIEYNLLPSNHIDADIFIHPLPHRAP